MQMLSLLLTWDTIEINILKSYDFKCERKILSKNDLIITIHDIDLFVKLNTDYNRIWFTLMFESNVCSFPKEVTIFYNNASWESKFFFYDFFTHNQDLMYRIE